MIFKKYKLLKEENAKLKEQINWYENVKIPVCTVETKNPVEMKVCKRYNTFELENDAKRYNTTSIKILEDYKQRAKEELANELIYKAIKIREDCQEQMIIAYIDILL